MKRKIISYGIALGIMVTIILFTNKPLHNSVLSEKEMSVIIGGQAPTKSHGKMICDAASGAPCPAQSCYYYDVTQVNGTNVNVYRQGIADDKAKYPKCKQTNQEHDHCEREKNKKCGNLYEYVGDGNCSDVNKQYIKDITVDTCRGGS